MPKESRQNIEIRRETVSVPYARALAEMDARNLAIQQGLAAEDGGAELIWLLEHPPVYTDGTSADVAELLDPRF